MKRVRGIVCFVAFLLFLLMGDSDVVLGEDGSGLQDWIIYEYNETNGLQIGRAHV